MTNLPLPVPTLAAGDLGTGLGSWWPLWVLLGIFAAVVVAAAAVGRRHGDDPLTWIPTGLERITGIPGWAASMVGMSWWGLLVAGIGFYNDVAWHVALGRDEELFTAPHTMILVGLDAILVSAIVGVFFATWTDASVGFRRFGLQIPRSAVAMFVLGAGAVSGFPLDELWHAAFGIDVTMWSPTHLLMIVGASLSPIAGWLALSEAGARPSDGRVTRGVYVALAWITLMGLASVQGEFEFGVPQFQALYLPVLLALAAGFALVLTRLALGPGWSLLVAALPLFTRGLEQVGPGNVDVVDTRLAGVYLGSAVAVEAVALIWGTQRRARFAVLSGLGIATLGLGVEWWWNQGAHQPWNRSLLPEAFVVGGLAALGAAVLATSFAGALAHRRLPSRFAAAGALAVIVALLVPLPRTAGDVTAHVALERFDDGTAHVEVALVPPDAADGARWFESISWQGGGAVVEPLHDAGGGVYRTTRPVPVTGSWKTLLRLHRGSDMMAVPVYLPADPEIGEPEIPAVDRTAPFVAESRYLLREQDVGNVWFAWAIAGTVLAAGAIWMWSFTTVAARLSRPRVTTAA